MHTGDGSVQIKKETFFQAFCFTVPMRFGLDAITRTFIIAHYELLTAHCRVAERIRQSAFGWEVVYTVSTYHRMSLTLGTIRVKFEIKIFPGARFKKFKYKTKNIFNPYANLSVGRVATI